MLDPPHKNPSLRGLHGLVNGCGFCGTHLALDLGPAGQVPYTDTGQVP